MRREEKSNMQTAVLDLRGVPCPLSWARAKVRLETLSKGEVLELWVDDPKGASDIPRAAESEGYAAEVADAAERFWRIHIEV